MLSPRTLRLRALFSLLLCQWTRALLAENASITYADAHAEGRQQVLGWTGSDAQGFSTHTDYLKFSLQNELRKRLSPEARIVLDGEGDFATFDARYTNYKRPSYVAAVQVAEEKDVVETVRMDAKLRIGSETHISRLTTHVRGGFNLRHGQARTLSQHLFGG